MKIIHLVFGKANPHRMNGVNKIVHQLASTQTTMGEDVSVWGIANDLEHNYPPRNFKTVLFQQYKSKRLSTKLKAALSTLTAKDRVHIHGAFILEFSRAAQLLKQMGVPYIFTPHGPYSKAAMQKNKWVKKIYFQLIEKRLIQSASVIQLSGINELNDLRKMMKLDNEQLIPNGMDFKQIPTDLGVRQNKELIFGFCGRLNQYHKGLDLMIMGFKEFLKNGGQATLALIGDGKDRPILEKMVQDLGIQERVVFHGALFGLKKFHTIHQFDVFLHTSRMEGFPMAILEAGALAIPSITSEATNINSYILQYNAGIALQENTPNHIADAMRTFAKFYQNKELKKYGDNAEKMVRAVFNWKTIAQQLSSAYAV